MGACLAVDRASIDRCLPPAKRLSDIQDEYHPIDLGSYPFHREARYGTTLVMRGTDEAGVDAMLDAVARMIVDLGGEPVDDQKD